MPFALAVIGLLLVVTGVQGTHKAFAEQLYKDFTGQGNFTYWIASLGAIGFLGYVPQLRSFSRVFMTLILLSMIVANKGLFNKLSEALNSGPKEPSQTAI